MTTWLKDSNDNKCSVEWFGSKEAAQAALDSLTDCKDCINYAAANAANAANADKKAARGIRRSAFRQRGTEK